MGEGGVALGVVQPLVQLLQLGRIPSSRSSTASSCRSSIVFCRPRCDSTVGLVAYRSEQADASTPRPSTTSNGDPWRPRTNS